MRTDSPDGGKGGVCIASGSVTQIAQTDVLGIQWNIRSDNELAELSAQGNLDAFEELVSRHQRAVYSVISRITRCREDVDDLVQDTFVSAYRSIRSFRGDAGFATWLHSIAVNATLKQMKRQKNRQTMSLDDPDTALGEILPAQDAPDPADLAQAAMRNSDVRKAIDCLPDKQRVVVLLHYFEDKTCEEIAQVLHCSVGTVWSRLHYACKKLRGQLDWLSNEL